MDAVKDEEALATAKKFYERAGLLQRSDHHFCP
jgi:hypothetical protein